jgi:hypothetical protein
MVKDPVEVHMDREPLSWTEQDLRMQHQSQGKPPGRKVLEGYY